MSASLRSAVFAAVALAASLAPVAQTVQVRGTVTDDDGPIRLARVTVQDTDDAGDTLAVAFTDASGEFSAAVAATSGEDVPPETAYGVGWPFPNPASADRVTVPFTTPNDRPEPVEAQTFDLLGRQTTAGAPLAAGVYLVRLRFADGTFSRVQRIVAVQSGVRVVAEHTTTALDSPTPAKTGASSAAPLVFVTIERAGYVTETRSADAAGGLNLSVMLSDAPAPTAQITPPGTVQAGTAITLDGSASVGAGGEMLAYSWAFGDGFRGGNARVAHVYTEAGTYTVTLTVQGAFGATAATTAEVTVTDPPAPSGAAPVRVRVRGVSGGPVVGAEVRVVGGTASATTGADGEAVVEGVPTGVPVALAVSKPGFATQRISLDLPDGTPSAFREVTLGARQPAQTLRNAEQGGAMGGVEGVRVTLPVEGLVHADGTPASGDVEVRLTPVDVSDRDELGVFPGEFAGVTPDGIAPIILSYGTAEYVFEQDGETLDLAPGKTATIEIPIYIADDGQGNDLAPGDPFPLWSLDETTGTWVLEGEGVVVASVGSPTGLALRAEVSHFSWWNCDIDPDPIIILPEIVDENGDPVAPDTPITISGSTERGPAGRPTVSGPAGSFGPGGRPLPGPPDTDVFLEGIANNGLDRGTATVNGEPGSTQTVTIVLRPVGSGGGDIAPDTSFVAAIDPEGDVDSYTFEAESGAFVRITAGSAAGSSLRGTVTLRGPDGTEITSGSFQPGVDFAFQALVEQTGLFAIEVDGTSGEPGTYRLGLVGGQTQQIAVGSEASVPVPSDGTAASFTFEAAEGQPVDVYLGSEDLAQGQLRVFSPDGTEIPRISSGLRLNASAYIELAEAGTYFVTLDVPAQNAGTAVVALRAVPMIQPGDVVSGALRGGERHNYRFEAEAGTLVRAGAISPDADPTALILQTVGAPRTESRAFGVEQLGNGTYRMEVLESGRSAAPAYTAALNGVASVTDLAPLVAGADGRAEVTGRIDRPGDLALYRIDAADGTGVVAALTADGADPLGVSASVSIAPLDAGDLFPGQGTETGTSAFPQALRFDPEFDVFPADRPPGLLEALGARLPEAETYIVAVAAGPFGFSGVEVGDEPTGAFALRADLAAPAAQIEVDDDLSECPSAATRSLHAAAFAATATTTVTACAGRYAEGISLALYGGATIAGTSRDDVVVASTVGGGSRPLIDVGPDGAGLTLRDVTVETNGQAAWIRADDVAVGGVAVRSGSSVSSQGIGGIQVDGASAQFDDMDVAGGAETVSFGVLVNVPFGGDGPTITNSRFAGAPPFGMVSVQGRGATITDNTFELTGGTAIRVLGSGQPSGGHTVTRNVVTVSGGGSSGGIIGVVARGPDAPETVVADNRIETAQGGGFSTPTAFELRADGTRMVAERNEVIATSADGIQGLSVQTSRGGEVVVRNSVFSGIGLFTP
ncbi:MAG: PKD domain-containing protein, partial [Bacteroidota bacterium]